MLKNMTANLAKGITAGLETLLSHHCLTSKRSPPKENELKGGSSRRYARANCTMVSDSANDIRSFPRSSTSVFNMMTRTVSSDMKMQCGRLDEETMLWRSRRWVTSSCFR